MASRFGDNCKSVLGDLTILTGGQVVTNELDMKLEQLTPDMLGSFGSITITKEDTIVLNGEGSKDAIQQRCEQIRSLIAEPTTSEYDRTKLQKHLAKLSGGVAVIKVGGSSEVEEGILPGGGVALLKASLALTSKAPGSQATASPDVKPIPTANFDQDLGVSIIKRALSHPARTILKNAGEESSVLVGTMIQQYGAEDKFAWGYDASKGEWVDMIKGGIVDPLKVIRTALVDAAGVASLLTTSEACVVEAPEEKAPAAPGDGMGGMGF
ncbi:chaperonin Cpn60/TCP-1 family [Rhodofomes roseus]|uniref:Chaperonin Cpn60/TCP-1 family n=1 Tax=Rhodofomes roseus TaxID=34475 RepID=A0ABQ8KVJ1_9APHY|nr:chaperonin Cpn60/TCP-1 family [Rhodofomes roseus]KAH9843097.1 chaperonin Cpn60/TCP-1 family [Rhodofomes roseus]